MRTHFSSAEMYPLWMADFLRDPRVAHNAGRTLRSARSRAAAIRNVSLEDAISRRPLLMVTFDIERDIEEPFESSVSRTARPFLDEFHRRAVATSLQATFFVQGEMVPGLADVLTASVEAGHEVGLHGYRHELWGTANWIARRPPLLPRERASRIEASLRAFESALLPRPVSFRAPNFTSDAVTYSLLDRYGFTVDSSPPSQTGRYWTPRSIGNVRVVPVSCAPIPEARTHPRLGVTTFARYLQFNFDVLMDTGMDRLRTLVADVLRFQVALGVRPHLVLYAHNWEFARRGLSQSCRDYGARCAALARHFGLQSVTMRAAAEGLFGDGKERPLTHTEVPISS